MIYQVQDNIIFLKINQLIMDGNHHFNPNQIETVIFLIRKHQGLDFIKLNKDKRKIKQLYCKINKIFAKVRNFLLRSFSQVIRKIQSNKFLVLVVINIRFLHLNLYIKELKYLEILCLLKKIDLTFKLITQVIIINKMMVRICIHIIKNQYSIIKKVY